MSLLSSGLKAIGGKLGGKAVTKALGLIPGVGTALTLGSIAYDVYSAVKPTTSPLGPVPVPFVPPKTTGSLVRLPSPGSAGGPMVTDGPVAQAFMASIGKYPTQSEYNQVAALWDVYGPSDPRVTDAIRQYAAGPGGGGGQVNMAGMGGVPSWGNLAKRGAAVVAGNRWVRSVVGGVASWLLVDAAGNVIDKWFGPGSPPGAGKRRTMNPFNPKALARADRRVRAFSDRSRPILRELGYTVSSHRHVKSKKKKRR